jgi:hypothetical protein
MTYNTPTLLLIGNAQNLVLGKTSDLSVCQYDGGQIPSDSDEPEIW